MENGRRLIQKHTVFRLLFYDDGKSATTVDFFFTEGPKK